MPATPRCCWADAFSRPPPALLSSARAKMPRLPHGDLTMQHLTIVTTGGTIDKIYFDDKSDYKIGSAADRRDPRPARRGVPVRRDPDPAQGQPAHGRRGSRAGAQHHRSAAASPRAGDARHRHHGRNRARAGAYRRQGDRIDRRAEPGALSRDRMRCSTSAAPWQRCRRCPMASTSP
jgi:hypothetical protein